MTRYSKIALGYSAAFGLLVGTAVATPDAATPAGTARAYGDTVKVVLESVNESSASGVATLQETEEGQTALELEVRGAEAAEAPLIAVLVTGTCQEPGELRAALGAIEAGAEGDSRAEFVLGEGIDEVLSVPTIVQVQPAGADAEPVACGQLGPVVAAQPYSEPAATPVPDAIPADDIEEEEEQADEAEGEDADEAEDADEGEASEGATEDQG